jgi:hypothetical protein
MDHGSCLICDYVVTFPFAFPVCPLSLRPREQKSCCRMIALETEFIMAPPGWPASISASQHSLVKNLTDQLGLQVQC